ncbi:bacillithiol biosynthesis deacetylase BshB1 [Pontibacter sp. BT310]|uniref:Bacillithiol biosynthesis deacetylase BshB1 n=1 Tax=Pontibacter populi TaxID=890055 RepID=A0ABS6X9V2_9BACT|nr:MULTISPECIES: bacillithiol biosynthesis deacetylase BshB1 [Pontibacter]MBJ6117930.1 bacillithiol biosynthesis deacetylase BshB1 [Pontibacter sp. BT310]MBR0570357.1 bacillithiol biosynthesis deacetylase BshB1 [Microvirga sp. STS03]MBW3364783.1 bacillithiol biosynthesis deacetylase BshB1 [Pontibacter populi]
MKLDILIFAAHPDDAELGCSGTIVAHIAACKKVGIVDLTRGELGTRGTPETRAAEAKAASEILGLSVRDNLDLADGFFVNDKVHQLKVVEKIRQYKPELVIMNAIHDRHPDHAKGSKLVSESCFLSGLKMIETTGPDGEKQEAWRPKAVYHYIQDRYIKPDVIVDITPFWEKKLESIRAFKSQFYNPADSSENTYISSPEFMEFLEARAKEFGHAIGVTYGEGFTVERHIGVKNLFDLI